MSAAEALPAAEAAGAAAADTDSAVATATAAAAAPPVESAPRARKRARGNGEYGEGGGGGGEEMAEMVEAARDALVRPSRRAKLAASAAISSAAGRTASAGRGGGRARGGADAATAGDAPETADPTVDGRAPPGGGSGMDGGYADGGRSRVSVRRRGKDSAELVAAAAPPPPPPPREAAPPPGCGPGPGALCGAAGAGGGGDGGDDGGGGVGKDLEAPAPPTGARRGKKGSTAATAAAGTKASADPRVAVLPPSEAEALRGQPLLDLGELVTGVLVRRPSATIRTPYVADVSLLPPEEAEARGGGGGGGPVVLAHAPALDCAGMVTPGCRVYLSDSAASRREGAPPTATSHAIQLVEDQRPGGQVAVVGAHPQLAERLAAEMLRRRCLEPDLGLYDAVETQRTYGNTRVDFVLRMADGSSTLLEVKNVVCADFPEGGVPPGRPTVGVYTAPVPPPGSRGVAYTPTALFPHGAQKPKIKVVSDRAIKHVWELTQLHTQAAEEAAIGAAVGGEAEAAEPAPAPVPAPAPAVPRLRCAVLFVVNRSDCSAFRPCHEADPLFAGVLRAAQEAGVTLLAYDIVWRGGAAVLGKRLPVVFGEGVSGRYDSARLEEVLAFNAADPRKNKNWKKAAEDANAKADADTRAKSRKAGKAGRAGTADAAVGKATAQAATRGEAEKVGQGGKGSGGRGGSKKGA